MNRPTLYRLYRIISLIKEREKVSLKAMSSDIEVCERTILRDLDLMRFQMKVPLEYDKHTKCWHLRDSDFFLPTLEFTDEDYKALRVGFDILKFVTPNPNKRVIRRAINALGFIVQKNFPKYEISFLSASYAGHFISDNDKLADIFEDTSEAIVHTIKIKIKYYSPYKNKFSSRVIWPLHLHNHGGYWFVLGFDEEKKDFRLFALRRVIKLDAIQEKFEVPKDFESDGYAEDYIKRCFTRQLGKLYTVRIKFDSYQSRWIKEQSWFKDQKKQEFKNGEIILEFEVSELEELRRWIMQYGSHAKILSPDELKDQIKEEIKKMEKIYASS